MQKREAWLEVETDKVNVEIGAPDEGVLNGINTRDGDFVEFGCVRYH